MKYQRIFWLDDNPTFLEWPFSILQSLNLPHLELPSLLERVIFAHDFEDGAAILRTNSPFDLYILDGDFPDKLNLTRKVELKTLIDRLKTGEKKVRISSFVESDNPGYGNFQRFYIQNSIFGTVIVYSIAEPAGYEAYCLGLPFYHKSLSKTPEKVLEDARRYHKWPPLDEAKLAAWEHGTTRELIERYLLKQ